MLTVKKREPMSQNNTVNNSVLNVELKEDHTQDILDLEDHTQDILDLSPTCEDILNPEESKDNKIHTLDEFLNWAFNKKKAVA